MNNSDKKRFSFVKRAESFTHAWRGVYVFLRSTHNAYIEIAAFALGTFLALYFQITAVEWVVLILSAGLVFASEAFNTAMEIDMNLTSPEYHPYARDVKDVAAGAVLISVVISLIITAIVFVPYFITLY